MDWRYRLYNASCFYVDAPNQKLKALGTASVAPTIFNINEPIVLAVLLEPTIDGSDVVTRVDIAINCLVIYESHCFCTYSNSHVSNVVLSIFRLPLG